MTITLDAYSLNVKHGFEDGDVLGESLMEIYPGTIGEPKDLVAPLGWQNAFEHVVLYRLVQEHLLPLLPDKPTIFFMHTHHNPVRFTDYTEHPAYDPPIRVDVTLDHIRAAAKWVEDEWVAGRPGVPETDDE